MLHVNQPLRDVDLIVRLQDHVFVSASFFDYPLQIDGKILPVLPCDFHFSLVGEIAEAAGPNNCFTDSVTFIRGNFLRALTFDRTVDINPTARFLAYSFDRKNDSGTIVILLFERGSYGVGELAAGPSLCRHQSYVGNLQFAIVVHTKML